MQEAARQHWLAFDEHTNVDMDTEDFGFNTGLQNAIEIGSTFILFGILPRPGGILDQDADEWADIKMYAHGLAWARKKKGDNNGSGEPEAQYVEPNFEGAVDWQTLPR